MTLPSRQELLKRAEALIARQRPVVQARRERWWSDEAQAELQAFHAGGLLPRSAEALQLLAVDLELDEAV